MRFVRAIHKASHLRTCYPVWFGEESLLLPEGCLRASTKEDRWGGVAIATSVVPGKPTFPVGFGVVATCYIGRLEQVSLGGLEASWSANYTGRVWHSSLSPSVPSILTEIQPLVFQIFTVALSNRHTILFLFVCVTITVSYNAYTCLFKSESHATRNKDPSLFGDLARAEWYRFWLYPVPHCSMNQSQRLRFEASHLPHTLKHRHTVIPLKWVNIYLVVYTKC